MCAEIIVKTCYAIPCSTPFNMNPIKIIKNDIETLWKIENGTSKVIENYEESDKEDNFSKKVVYKNHGIEDNQFNPTEIDEKIISISEELRNSCERLTGKYLLNFELTFGIDDKENSIYLCKNCIVELSKDCYEETLFKDSENFNEFLSQQITTPIPKNKCISNTKECTNPQYKCLLIDVIFSKACDQYPKVNKKLLFDLIKSRLIKMSPNLLDNKVRCCLPCYLKYSAAHREYQIANEYSRKEKIEASKDFEAFMEREQSERGLESVGTVPTMHKTYCYALNMKYSPYHNQIFQIKAVPRTSLTPIKKMRFSKNSESTRLSSGETHLLKQRVIPRDTLKKPESVEIPSPKKLPKTYSEKLARKTYGCTPFDRSYISNKSRGKRF